MKTEIKDKLGQPIINMRGTHALNLSAGSRIVKRDRPWHLYPNGTKAVAPNGGHYLRETGGWKWCAGDLFPRPSADVDRVILPENTVVE